MKPQQLKMGLVLIGLITAVAALALYVSWVWALVGGGCALGASGMLAAWRLACRVQEQTVRGRTLNRTVRVLWEGRRQLGRAWRKQAVYLVLGPTQVGKSALVDAATDNDRLVVEPAAAPEAHVRLVAQGGKVFLEVPGRLVRGGDHSLWRGFLRVLCWLGLARRIRGVWLVSDVARVREGAEPKMWGEVLQALVDTLGVRPPIYLLLTRCDEIPGFTETFARATEATVAAPWGFAIDDTDETALTVGHRFDALIDTLQAYALASLSTHDSRAARAPLYLFPQYVGTLRRGLMHWVENAFGTQAQAQRPRLGGVYLMAAQALGSESALGLSPVDAAQQIPAPESSGMPAVWNAQALAHTLWDAPSSALQMSRLETRPTCYFITGFVRTVLAHDAGLSAAVQQLGLWGSMRRARGSLTLAALVLFAGLWAASQCLITLGDLGRVEQALRAPQATVDAQRSLEALRLALAPRPGTALGTLASRLGFTAPALRAPVAALYLRTLEHELVGPLMARDAAALAASWRTHAYAGSAPDVAEATAAAVRLRAHLLLTGPKADHEPALLGREAAWLGGALMMQLTGDSVPADAESMAVLEQQLALYVALLAEFPAEAPPRDEALVSRTRALLARRPLADRLIDGMLYEVGLMVPSVRLDDVLPPGPMPLYGRAEVPAAFTHKGYIDYVEAWLKHQDHAHSDAWIFWDTAPSHAQQRALNQVVRARYFARYTEAWREFLAQIAWRKPQDAHAGLDMLVALTRSEPPPLVAIFRLLALHTQWPLAMTADPKVAAGQGILAELRRRLVTDAEGMAQGAPTQVAPGPQALARAFQPLVTFAGVGAAQDGAAEGQAPLASYYALLHVLRTAVDGFIESPRSPNEMAQELRLARQTASALVQNAPYGGSTRATLQQLLLVPLDHMTQALTRGARTQVQATWCPAVVQPAAHLARRYPFDPSGPDASLADVAQYFHPTQGSAWQVYQEFLKDDLIRQLDTFRFDERLGGVLKRTYRPELPHFYNALWAASQALFGGRDQAMPATEFDVRLRIDQDLWEVQLMLDGVRLAVEPGHHASPWQRSRWPNRAACEGAQLLIVAKGGVKEQLDFEGPWGLWHLMEAGQAHIDRDHGVITISFRPAGMTGHARLEIRPTQRAQPFYLAHAQGRAGGLFAYLRGGVTRPPRAVAAGYAGCAAP